MTDFKQRLFDAYAAKVARVDTNGDGVISAAESDIDTASIRSWLAVTSCSLRPPRQSEQLRSRLPSTLAVRYGSASAESFAQIA